MVTVRDEETTVAANELARALRRGLAVTERRLDVAGVSTVVLEGGEGPPVVLLHGQGAFAESLAPVITGLLDGHRIVAPDLPGLGRSVVADPDGLDGGLVMAWLAELIDLTCAESPILVGVSLGGTVAAHFAIEHGDRVRGIVLVDSGSLGRFRPAPAALLALLRYVRRPSASAFARFARYALAHPDGVAAPDAEASPFVVYHVDRARQPSVRAANRRLVRWSIRPIPVDKLRTIRVPVSLIWGAEDHIMRARIARRASARLGWPLVAIPECGHVPFVDQPQAFLAALRTALEARS
jgi:pimeloyl-ACP methyl ester carboxylesterase